MEESKLFREDKRKRALSLFGILFLSLLLWRGESFSKIDDCRNIPTDKGKVSGKLLKQEEVCAFLGIPYVAPPIENLRFALPQPHKPWAKPWRAEEYSPECIQRSKRKTGENGKPLDSEDCLYLNIWQPLRSDPKQKPVMVFIHGGGFVSGSGNLSLYEGRNLASWGDVVVVTFNYRLGPFGFLAHPSLRETGGEGNYGLYDQIAALQWIQGNIAHFGGDANNVTIFGESAGGISVGALLLSPLSTGLFQKAIIQSGPIFILAEEMGKAEKKGEKVAQKVGCTVPQTELSCLRKKDARELLKAASSGDLLSLFAKGEKAQKEIEMGASAVVDKTLLPDKALYLLTKGKYHKEIPVMIGSNSDEVAPLTLVIKIRNQEEYENVVAKIVTLVQNILHLPFQKERLLNLYTHEEFGTYRKAIVQMASDIGFTCPTLLTAKLLSSHGTPVYLYHSALRARKGMLSKLGAFHGMELPFIFGNFTYEGLHFQEEDSLEVAKRVSSLWTSFAKTSVPSVEGVPALSRFDPKQEAYLQIDSKSEIRYHLKSEKCAYFEEVMQSSIH